MKELDRDASNLEIIHAINRLVRSNNALAKTLMNFYGRDKTTFLENRIDNIEKKIVALGDRFVTQLQINSNSQKT